VKTKVEAPKKNPVGRPRKRPKGVEDLVSSEHPEVIEAIGKLRKPEPLVSMAHQVVLEEVFEECFPVDGEEQHQGEEPVEEDLQEALEDGPQGKELVEEDFQEALEDGQSKPKPIELKQEFGKLGFEVQDWTLVAIERAKAGNSGGEHGWKGGEFGSLGGRPRKQVEALSEGQRLNPVSDRKKQCTKALRDDSFGIIARLEVCALVKKLLTTFQTGGFELSDVCTILRPKEKTKWAHENEAEWLAEKEGLSLGAGIKVSLSTQGVRSNVGVKFSTSRGLRTSGAGAKPLLEGHYPAMREYLGIERAGGRFVDSEDLDLEFEALLNNLKAELESEQERLASVGGKLSPFKQRQLEELLKKWPGCGFTALESTGLQG
jgi:hypothetical protein